MSVLRDWHESRGHECVARSEGQLCCVDLWLKTETEGVETVLCRRSPAESDAYVQGLRAGIRTLSMFLTEGVGVDGLAPAVGKANAVADACETTIRGELP